jgi:HTH-type transcriptional repressor of NAD biosynthesis genes
VRQEWLEKTYRESEDIAIRIVSYRESDLPNTSVSSRQVSEVWAAKFREVLPDVQVLVTSEPYGEFVAEYMGISHIPYDPERSMTPVSASAILKNLAGNWHYLPEAVKPWYSRKVVILGTESTGKTTLTQRLAGHFGAGYVLEFGRETIADSNAFTEQDLFRVAVEHARRIEAAISESGPLLIIDTDIHITQSYATFAFGRELDLPAHLYAANKADLCLYLTPDVPYVQDGTRLSQSDRDRLDVFHRQTLIRHNVSFVELPGSWEVKFEKARELIRPLI